MAPSAKRPDVSTCSDSRTWTGEGGGGKREAPSVPHKLAHRIRRQNCLITVRVVRKNGAQGACEAIASSARRVGMDVRTVRDGIPEYRDVPERLQHNIEKTVVLASPVPQAPVRVLGRGHELLEGAADDRAGGPNRDDPGYYDSQRLTRRLAGRHAVSREQREACGREGYFGVSAATLPIGQLTCRSRPVAF